MTKVSEDLKEWCRIFEHTDAELMAELYADGISIPDIAEKFTCSQQTVRLKISPYTASTEQVEQMRRDYVRKVLDAHPRRH